MPALRSSSMNEKNIGISLLDYGCRAWRTADGLARPCPTGAVYGDLTKAF